MSRKPQRIGKAVSLMLLMAGVGQGAVDTTMAWDPSITDINGQVLDGEVRYKLFFSEEPGAEVQSVDAGSSTQAVVAGLEYNKTYFFKAKAYTATGESAFSEEVAWAAPVMPDTDADGLSDIWEQEYFQSLGVAQSATDYDGDGVSDLEEFIAGTNPTDPADYPLLEIHSGATGAEINFLAKQASGNGYENRSRYYTLMQCENLIAGVWTAVPGMENILAADQIVSCVAALDGRSVFYSTQIQLN